MTGVLRFHEKSWSLTYWPQFLTDSKNFFAKIYDWVTPPYQVGVNRIKRNYVRSQISTCRRLRRQISLKITRIDLPTPIFELFQKFVRQNLWLGHTPIPSRCEQDQKKFFQMSSKSYLAHMKRTLDRLTGNYSLQEGNIGQSMHKSKPVDQNHRGPHSLTEANGSAGAGDDARDWRQIPPGTWERKSAE